MGYSLVQTIRFFSASSDFLEMDVALEKNPADIHGSFLLFPKAFLFVYHAGNIELQNDLSGFSRGDFSSLKVSWDAIVVRIQDQVADLLVCLSRDSKNPLA